MNQQEMQRAKRENGTLFEIEKKKNKKKLKRKKRKNKITAAAYIDDENMFFSNSQFF